jgi:hypothetical protein
MSRRPRSADEADQQIGSNVRRWLDDGPDGWSEGVVIAVRPLPAAGELTGPDFEYYVA